MSIPASWADVTIRKNGNTHGKEWVLVVGNEGLEEEVELAQKNVALKVVDYLITSSPVGH